MTDAKSPWSYDSSNIFARILRGEIPNKTVIETENTLVFHDLYPQAPVHVLVIPKGAYVDFAHFAAEASEAEIVDFHRVAAQVCAELGLNAGGYRGITNSGAHGHQEVPHYHLHLLGGRALGPLLSKG
ncbi:histidine triad nucleotide-binding protein [Xinfangfangia sp. CPCC 101601]|uniref:Histidine triad nucleotide-binding protein n=1 Tax=Pseudogemmobacter lacusdianii TaxID=3069608 RepID=A0ABU0VYW6_9RHOB|nr:histidine triad nucleotide-binding protein [Xinfangfangia sp. CPCC 101601]MDQ2066914.1 histidine triad nucleotide-binding protein [Xinfangfangia sp. CPCC 101601]